MIRRPRFAVCLYGRYGNRFSDDAGKGGLDYILNHVARDVDADFFVFSFNSSKSREIVTTLGSKLVVSKFPSIPDVLKSFRELGGDESLFQSPDTTRGVESTLLFLTQRDGSIGLMLDHIAASGVCYDGVLVCRIDLGQIDQVNGRFPQKVSEAPQISTLPLPLEHVYHAAWNQLNEGLPDQWFILSVEHAKSLYGSARRAGEALSRGSDYLERFCRAIPDSNAASNFSNEINRKSEFAVLATRPTHLALDNHLLHKYDFIKTGLYSALAPAFDSRGIAHLTYTHSSYLDGLNMSHEAQMRHLGRFTTEYLAIETGSSARVLPSNQKILMYEEELSYTERLIQVLRQIPEEFIFFTHEDMPLLGTPVTNAILEAKSLLAKSPKNAVVRMIRVGRGFRLNLNVPSRLPYFWKVGVVSRWKFSIQPSLWRREHLLSLLERVGPSTVWELEVKGQSVFRSLGLTAYQPL